MRDDRAEGRDRIHAKDPGARAGATRLTGSHRRGACLHLQHGVGVGEQLEGGRALGDLELLVVHVCADLGEERRREVALARVGQHGEDDLVRVGC